MEVLVKEIQRCENETKTEVMCLRMRICNKKRGGKAKVFFLVNEKGDRPPTQQNRN